MEHPVASQLAEHQGTNPGGLAGLQERLAQGAAARFEERLVRLDELERLTGLRKSSLYELQQGGAFPRSVQITGSRVAWKLSEVMAWIDARPRSTGGKS